MRKSNVIFMSLIMVMGLFMVSCDNDDDIKCPDALTGALAANETAFSGSWVFSAMVAEEAIDVTDDNTANPSTDIFNQYEPCTRDLSYDFKNNRDYALKLGGIVADCNKETITGTWSLSPINNLTFVSGCSSQAIQITLNEDGTQFSYKLNANLKNINGEFKVTPVTYTYTKLSPEATPQ